MGWKLWHSLISCGYIAHGSIQYLIRRYSVDNLHFFFHTQKRICLTWGRSHGFPSRTVWSWKEKPWVQFQVRQFLSLCMLQYLSLQLFRLWRDLDEQMNVLLCNGLASYQLSHLWLYLSSLCVCLSPDSSGMGHRYVGKHSFANMDCFAQRPTWSAHQLIWHVVRKRESLWKFLARYIWMPVYPCYSSRPWKGQILPHCIAHDTSNYFGQV